MYPPLCDEGLCPPHHRTIPTCGCFLSFGGSRSRRLTLSRRLSFPLDRRSLQGHGGFRCLRFVFGGVVCGFWTFSICTGGEGARCCRRKGWFLFWCFFVCFVWLGRWRCSWCVVGCLPVVIWFSWVSDYLIRFLSWLWMEVMLAHNIGGDGSVTMVVMDYIWVRL